MLSGLLRTAPANTSPKNVSGSAGCSTCSRASTCSAEERSALERSIAQLDRLFLLVVIGEFNAGKSAFVNALAGARILEEGVTPTTTTLQILQFGEARERADR